MSTRVGRRSALLSFYYAAPLMAFTIAAICTFAFVSDAIASTHHNVNGATTPDGSGHSSNPGHVWVAVGAPKGPQMSSGGRYHDCTPGTPIRYCHAANGDDAAVDIDGYSLGGNYLYLRWAGYGTGSSPTPNVWGPTISISAVLVAKGNYAGNPSSYPQCNWQKYDIRVSYTDLQGGYKTSTIGSVYYAHLWDWAHTTLGTVISANSTELLSTGSYVQFVDAVYIGSVYNGGGGCSSGPHTHFSFVNAHNVAVPYEWHGYGPDYYFDSHVHGGGGTHPAQAYDTVTYGVTVAFLGGDRVRSPSNPGVQAIWDNPGAGDH